MDITGFMQSFLTYMVYLFTWFFNTLGSITFFGTSLLQFCITILILGVVLDLMLSLVKSRSFRDVSKKAASSGKKEESE